MNESSTNLTLDIYDFWGYRIGIQSNSGEILSHFRSVYGRFYCGENPPGSSDVEPLSSHPSCVIEAVDNIEKQRELSLNDGNEFYTLHCRNLYEFDQAYYGKGSVPDPIAFITYLFLKNKYRMVQGYQLFHAAALSRDGRAVILPALEHMGKTTLSIQLARDGFKFLSDEVACINPEEGRIEPYPRKLNINASSCDLLGLPPWPDEYLRRSGTDETEWAVDIEQIVPDSLSPACRPAYIVFLRGFGETPRLEPVSSSNALFKLFEYSFTSSSLPASQLFKFAPILEDIACYSLVCADLKKTAGLIAGLFNGAGPPGN